ncbi:hypothetical protein [Micromonospora sp. Llam0]|uniref:hypothetical protein n=1 Tax=Micromonospora sp. Llam0 TaxID=2485143 RepID=UPI000F46B876|nr:hypothetical protein [Micromonospora sp. Llam0]
MDGEFRDLVRDFELMLDEVLERCRDRYVEVFARLDELLGAVPPRRSEARVLKDRFRSNFVTRHYFFSRATADWIGPLREEGFFATPPAPVFGEDQSVTLPPWPETDYLVRISADDPTGVLDAARSVPATENSRVTWNLMQIALALPADLAVQLAPQITSAVPGEYGVLAPEAVGELIVHLATGGHPEAALSLAKALLAAVPPRRGRSANRMSGYDYAEVLRSTAPALIHAAGRPAFTLLCDLLERAVVAGNPDSSGRAETHDDSWRWRPAIEDDPDAEHDPRSSLTDAVRAAARQIIGDNEMTIDEVVAELGIHRWTIFTRLILDLLREHGAQVPVIVGRFLTDASVMSDDQVEREYLLLAAAGQPWLEPRDQQKMIALIAQGPDEAWYQGWRSDVATSAIDAYAETWQRDRYASIEPILSAQERACLLMLLAEHGPVPDRTQAPPAVVAVWGGNSPLSAAQISRMTTDELAEFLRTWQPPSTTTWPREDHGSLRVALTESVEADAETRSAEAGAFVGLPPDYVGPIVEALWRAAAKKRNLNWEGVRPLCAWINEQAGAELSSGVTGRTQRIWVRLFWSEELIAYGRGVVAGSGRGGVWVGWKVEGLLLVG